MKCLISIKIKLQTVKNLITKLPGSAASQPNSIKYLWNAYLLPQILNNKIEKGMFLNKKQSTYDKYTYLSHNVGMKIFFFPVNKTISKMSMIKYVALFPEEK